MESCDRRDSKRTTFAGTRSVVLASADGGVRQRLKSSLNAMRWQVCEATGGAEAMAQLEDSPQEALLLDAWLPDLEANEFARTLSALYPQLEVLRLDGSAVVKESRSPRRHELLHALREAHMDVHLGVQTAALERAAGAALSDTAMTQSAPLMPPTGLRSQESSPGLERPHALTPSAVAAVPVPPIEGLVGAGAAMQELARLVRLVAPRHTTVLIEGETGTGKELVAQAIYRLSNRANKGLTVLNCAAIPESLLEAELFGHTRGAFTGAVQSRTGRIEAANGGTLFLDEIGEMPLALQAKMLRFLESGELQRVGDNEVLHVDVRILAATHRDLETRAAEGSFRLDLYHRLAVFPLEIVPLRERKEDIPALTEHFLSKLGRSSPRKRESAEVLKALAEHSWPGNVRELGHVLERATILAGDAPVLAVEHIRVRRRPRLPTT